MKKTIIAILVILVVILIGHYVISKKNANVEEDTSTVPTSDTGSTNSQSTTPKSNPTSAGSETTNPKPPVSTPTTPAPVRVSVSIKDFAYSPAALTVKKGTIVTWTNNDNVTHTVTSNAGNAFRSDALAPGQSYSFTFNDVGNFNYTCSFHSTMHGTVTVE